MTDLLTALSRRERDSEQNYHEEIPLIQQISEDQMNIEEVNDVLSEYYDSEECEKDKEEFEDYNQ